MSITRFEKHIRKTQGCWLWLGGTKGPGYGVFRWNSSRVISAHKASYLLYKGIVPEGLFVCHNCNNPSCVNPDHLRVDTPKSNTKDMYERGTAHLVVGHRVNNKLTPEEEAYIRNSPLRCVTIMDIFGIGQSTVNAIRSK